MKFSYSGQVTDKNTGAPISGVKVLVKACDGTAGDSSQDGCSGNQVDAGSATTDANGNFSMTVDVASTGFYYIYLSKNGNAVGVNVEGVIDRQLTSNYKALSY